MLIVKEFGSTSVADRKCVFNVAEKCLKEYKNGHDIVVVLSAMGNHTEELIAQAKALNPNPSAREMDMLLSIGAQMSVAWMAMALEALEVPVISLNAYQTKIYTTKEHGNAEITEIETDRIRSELAQRKIVIVAGGQGMTDNNDITTLKGGSDTTAVALAVALHADFCESYKKEEKTGMEKESVA